jgi:hypothetical protein
MTYCSKSRECIQRESLNTSDSSHKDLRIQRVTVSKKDQFHSPQKHLMYNKRQRRLAVNISSGVSKAMEGLK